MDALCCTSREKILDRLSAVDTRAIPHDQQFPTNMTQYMPQKAYDISTVIGLLLDMQQQLASGCDRTDCRQVIVTTRRTQDRRLADRCPRTHQCRQQVESGFVYPDKRTALVFGLFLSAG